MKNIIIVNENDEVIGEEEIDKAIELGKIYRVARVFLINNIGQIFLQKRGPNVATNPNKWDHSAGGRADAGETWIESGLRELKEELGVETTLEEIEKYYSEENSDETKRKHWNMIFLGKYDGKMHLQESEVAGGKWFDIKEIDSMIKKDKKQFTDGFIIGYNKLRKLGKI